MVQQETPVTLPEPDQVTPDPEPTVEELKAQLVEADAKATKMEQDFQAVKTGRMRQQERDETMSGLKNDLAEFRDELRAVVKVNTALATGLSSGQTDGLPTQIAEITNQSQQDRNVRAQVAQYDHLVQIIDSANTDDDGNLIIALDSPEAAPIMSEWDAGRKSGDLSKIAQAGADLLKVITQAQRKKDKDEAAVLVAQERESTKRVREASLDLDAGAGVGGTGTKRRTYGDLQQFDIRGKTTREILAEIDEIDDQFYGNKGGS